MDRHEQAEQDPDFQVFVSSRAAALVRTARALLADPREAEDVVQGVLVKAHRHWASIARTGDPDAYVLRLLVTVATSRWRRAVRRSHARDAGDPMAGGLRRLPARERAVLVLRHYDGLDDVAVADALGTSVRTVRTEAWQGLDRLGRLLADDVRPVP